MAYTSDLFASLLKYRCSFLRLRTSVLEQGHDKHLFRFFLQSNSFATHCVFRFACLFPFYNNGNKNRKSSDFLGFIVSNLNLISRICLPEIGNPRHGFRVVCVAFQLLYAAGADPAIFVTDAPLRVPKALAL